MKIRYLALAAVLGLASLFAIAIPTTTAMATEYCFTKALNGDVLDPPQCGVAKAHSGSGGTNCPAGTKPTPPKAVEACEPIALNNVVVNPALNAGVALFAMFGIAGLLGRGYLPVFSIPGEGAGGGEGESDPGPAVPAGDESEQDEGEDEARPAEAGDGSEDDPA